MSDRDLEMVKLREQRDDAIQRAVTAELKLAAIEALAAEGGDYEILAIIEGETP
jgi:hypothetical protein